MTQAWRMDGTGRLHPDSPWAGPLPVVWIPTEQVTFVRARVPGRREKLWRQALPWAVEERLAQSVEQAHLHVLHRDRDGSTHCAVVDAQLLRNWTNRMEAAGLNDALLIPDCFRLPWREGERGALGMKTEERVLARTGPWSGLAAPTAIWPRLAERDERLAQSIRWLERPPRPPAETDWTALSLVAPRRDARHALRRRMVAAIALLVAAFGVHLIDVAWTTHRMNQQAERLRQQTERLFHQAFPQVGRLVKLRPQVRRQLAQSAEAAQSAPDPFAILSRWEPALLEASVKIRRLEWRSADRRWTLTMEAPAEKTLKTLQTRLGDAVRMEIRKTASGKIEGVLHGPTP